MESKTCDSNDYPKLCPHCLIFTFKKRILKIFSAEKQLINKIKIGIKAFPHVIKIPPEEFEDKALNPKIKENFSILSKFFRNRQAVETVQILNPEMNKKIPKNNHQNFQVQMQNFVDKECVMNKSMMTNKFPNETPKINHPNNNKSVDYSRFVPEAIPFHQQDIKNLTSQNNSIQKDQKMYVPEVAFKKEDLAKGNNKKELENVIKKELIPSSRLLHNNHEEKNYNNNHELPKKIKQGLNTQRKYQINPFKHLRAKTFGESIKLDAKRCSNMWDQNSEFIEDFK